MNTFFDSIVEIYDETRGLPEDTTAEIIDVIIKETGPESRILDLGVGTARFAHPLQMRGLDVVGLDLSNSMISCARAKGTRNLVRGDACMIPFSDSSFDHVICVHLLHLVEDCEGVLREIARVGRGTLISVLLKKSDFNPMDEYREALSFYGYELGTPGMGEKGLKDLLPPHLLVPVKGFYSRLSTKERIQLLSKRQHSYTLETPKEIHDDAIKYLHKKHSQHLDGCAQTEVEVVSWKIAEIKRKMSFQKRHNNKILF